MAEQSVYSWDTVDVDETITATDHAVSNNLDIQTPVGVFLVEIIESTPIEKAFKVYSCMAAKLKMKIMDVVKVEQPLIDSTGKQISRNGELVQKIQDVPAGKKAEVNALYAGRFVFDEINLAHPKEKDAMRNRRLFVAKKIGIITERSLALTTLMWAGAVGRQVLVTTEWNSWKDKDTEELKKKVKVAWAGYDFAENGGGNSAGGYHPQEQPAQEQPSEDAFANI
jgi:hypothetical protein